MSDLTTITTRIRALLHDPQGLFWAEEELEVNLRLALEMISDAHPPQATAVVTLANSGRMIPLEGLPGLRGVTEAWWPFDSARAEIDWPPNRVRAFRVVTHNGNKMLFLAAIHGGQPRQGDEVRICYTCEHTIAGLDAAAETSLAPAEERLLITGAAALLALSAAVDPELNRPVGPVSEMAARLLTLFEADLDRIRRSDARTTGEPWSAGWPVDKSDSLLTKGWS